MIFLIEITIGYLIKFENVWYKFCFSWVGMVIEIILVEIDYIIWLVYLFIFC